MFKLLQWIKYAILDFLGEKILDLANGMCQSVNQKAQEYENNGMTKERAAIEACNDLGILDFDEYNAAREQLEDQGKW